MKEFNTAAVCVPSKHYMVDLSERVAEIRKLVDAGAYFTINRARQYGKTTTLNALEYHLSSEYDVIALDFQDVTDADFISESAFTKALCQVICDTRDSMQIPVPDAFYDAFQELANEKRDVRLGDIFRLFDRWCKENRKRIVLIIDEVDTAANNQVFLDFLGKLRSNYLKRLKNPNYLTFQSVILAGVTDVKHLKSRIREDDSQKVNSPWNIAADFDIDMSLPEAGIKGMLDRYEEDHRTGMDTGMIAKQIREYTNGYPFLVSRICQIIDKKLVPSAFRSLEEAWSVYGVDEAVKRILSEDNTFFDSVMGKLENYPELKGQLRRLLLRGETIAFLPDDEEQKQLRMYGFIRNEHNRIAVDNRIFEMRLYNYFIGEGSRNSRLAQDAAASRSAFVAEDGWMDVPKIMEHFIAEYNRIHGDRPQRFLEEEGRERFLMYLSPIINGTGTYSIEEQTRDHNRMDVVVHYLGWRYVIELKIWRGERYHQKGEEQIIGYLDYFGLDTGYLLSFNFNRKKKPGVERVKIGSKTVYEGIV